MKNHPSPMEVHAEAGKTSSPSGIGGGIINLVTSPYFAGPLVGFIPSWLASLSGWSAETDQAGLILRISTVAACSSFLGLLAAYTPRSSRDAGLAGGMAGLAISADGLPALYSLIVSGTARTSGHAVDSLLVTVALTPTLPLLWMSLCAAVGALVAAMITSGAARSAPAPSSSPWIQATIALALAPLAGIWLDNSITQMLYARAILATNSDLNAAAAVGALCLPTATIIALVVYLGSIFGQSFRAIGHQFSPTSVPHALLACFAWAAAVTHTASVVLSLDGDDIIVAIASILAGLTLFTGATAFAWRRPTKATVTEAPPGWPLPAATAFGTVAFAANMYSGGLSIAVRSAAEMATGANGAVPSNLATAASEHLLQQTQLHAGFQPIRFSEPIYAFGWIGLVMLVAAHRRRK